LAHSSERRRRLGVEQLRRNICNSRLLHHRDAGAVPCGAVPFRGNALPWPWPWPCRGCHCGVPWRHWPFRRCRALAVAFRAALAAGESALSRATAAAARTAQKANGTGGVYPRVEVPTPKGPSDTEVRSSVVTVGVACCLFVRYTLQRLGLHVVYLCVTRCAGN
jgi:hypothetical protein